MNNQAQAKAFRAILLQAALLLCLFGTQQAGVFAQATGSKIELTPTFWQRDPDADFEDEGRMHCAPTSVSDGLIYLTKAFGMKNLVPGTGHKDQIKLIQDLAEDFGTDPNIGGTNPDKILTGLQSYVESKGYELKRLEHKSWRGVSALNKEFKIGTKPDMAWMRAAVLAKDTVVIFNFGWYRETEDSYERLRLSLVTLPQIRVSPASSRAGPDLYKTKPQNRVISMPQPCPSRHLSGSEEGNLHNCRSR